MHVSRGWAVQVSRLGEYRALRDDALTEQRAPVTGFSQGVSPTIGLTTVRSVDAEHRSPKLVSPGGPPGA